jgi:hypothetical protein
MDANGRVAVLAVVIAGVIALMVEKGLYTWGNTVFGLTLLAVLLAYGAPTDEETAEGKDQEPPDENASERQAERAAFGAALALCIMNIMGLILNYIPSLGEEPLLWGKPVLQDLPFFGLWFVITALGFWLRRRQFGQ